MSGFNLFQQAERFYHDGNITQAFETYQKCIKEIVNNEQVTVKLPVSIAQLPPDWPVELLPNVWRNFCGFIRDPKMNFTQETAPDAYKLLNSYRPGSPKEHTRFRGDAGQIILMALQVTAGLTLGLVAWDKKDRATAAKRYKEAIDLAAKHAPFLAASPASSRIERWVAKDVLDTKANLQIIIGNDAANAELLQRLGVPSGGDIRRTTVGGPIGMARVEKDGTVAFQAPGTVVVATDACKHCAKRDIKLLRCSKCTAVAYCDAKCQRADWKVHKPSCRTS